MSARTPGGAPLTDSEVIYATAGLDRSEFDPPTHSFTNVMRILSSIPRNFTCPDIGAVLSPGPRPGDFLRISENLRESQRISRISENLRESQRISEYIKESQESQRISENLKG